MLSYCLKQFLITAKIKTHQAVYKSSICHILGRLCKLQAKHPVVN